MIPQQALNRLIKYFGRSNFWAAWWWIKREWLVMRTNGQLYFLQECKRRGLLPRFVDGRIRTCSLFWNKELAKVHDHRRYEFGINVLNDLIQEEFRQRRLAVQVADQARKGMFHYSKEEYFEVRRMKEQVVSRERRTSFTRLNQKLSKLKPVYPTNLFIYLFILYCATIANG